MSLGALNPLDNPNEWDFITIQGVKSPGACEVGEAKRKHEWDVKKGKGAEGGFVTYVGKSPMTFSVKFYLWDVGDLEEASTGHNHFDEWDDFLPLLKYDPTKKAVQAVDFYHPSFEGLDLRSVVTESISNITHEGNGMYVRTVEFLEYIPPPPKPAVSTPSSSATGTGKGDGTKAPPGIPPDPALVAAQKEVADLTDRAKKEGAL